MTAWQLDSANFTLSQTIVTTRKNISGFGGYQVIENRPADDLYIGRLAAEQGLEVRLLPYVVQTVADFKSLNDLLYKRVRWMTVMRHMRPWGPSWFSLYVGSPVGTRGSSGVSHRRCCGRIFGKLFCVPHSDHWLIGGWGMKQTGLWKKVPLIPLWDALAFLIWLVSFVRKTIRWRGIDYLLREGKLVPAASGPAQSASA